MQLPIREPLLGVTTDPQNFNHVISYHAAYNGLTGTRIRGKRRPQWRGGALRIPLRNTLRGYRGLTCRHCRHWHSGGAPRDRCMESTNAADTPPAPPPGHSPPRTLRPIGQPARKQTPRTGMEDLGEHERSGGVHCTHDTMRRQTPQTEGMEDGEGEERKGEGRFDGERESESEGIALTPHISRAVNTMPGTTVIVGTTTNAQLDDTARAALLQLPPRPHPYP